jgi:hypothetical protein
MGKFLQVVWKVVRGMESFCVLMKVIEFPH